MNVLTKSLVNKLTWSLVKKLDYFLHVSCSFIWQNILPKLLLGMVSALVSWFRVVALLALEGKQGHYRGEYKVYSFLGQNFILLDSKRLDRLIP